MLRTVRPAFAVMSFTTLTLTLLAGCGGGEVAKSKVSGTLTNNGKPLEFDPMFGRVDMRFVPMTGNTRPSPSVLPEEMTTGPAAPPVATKGGTPVEIPIATVTPEGEFKVHGGLPDGKYLITIRHFPKGRKGGKLNDEDTLKGAFSIHKSPIIRDIKGDTNLSIDLAKVKE